MTVKNMGTKAFEYEEVEISTLHEFLIEIEKIKENEKENEKEEDEFEDEDDSPEMRSHFFRGQVVDKTPTPSLFRNSNLAKNENKMFFDVINRKPEDFNNCKTTFEHLVKMQHYYLPTRLLDITSNPLVALYFACKETNELKPKRTVFHISINDSSIKNYTSDSITILSSMAKVSIDSKELIKKKVLESVYYQMLFRGFIIDYIRKNKDASKFFNLLESNDGIEECIELVKDFHSRRYEMKFKGNSIRSLLLKNKLRKTLVNIKDVFKSVKSKTIRDFFQDRTFIISNIINPAFSHIQNDHLLHEIKQDKPYFLNGMRIDTFDTIFCVQPKLTNSRIIAQSGSFLMFPFKMEEDDIKMNIRMYRIYIEKGSESKILRELELLNIKEDTLFNELDVVCKSIEKKYKKSVTVDLDS